MTFITKTASITELRQQATALIHQVQEDQTPLLILQNSQVSGVLLDPGTFNELMEAYQDAKDYDLAVQAMAAPKEKTYTWKQVLSMRNKQ